MKRPPTVSAVRLLTKYNKNRTYSNMHKKQKAMFALAMQGCRGRSPLQERRCHSEAALASRPRCRRIS